MAAFSGKIASLLGGSSADLNELKKWDVEYGAQPEPYFSRHGAGAQETVAGGESGSGSMTFNFDAQDPIGKVLPQGALVTLTTTTYAGRTLTGSARIGKHKYTFDVSGVPIEVVVPFVTHGLWTLPTS